MKSDPLKALMRLSLLLPTMLALQACVLTPPIVAPSSACLELIPQDWRKPVRGAPLPPSDANVGDWIVFGNAQTGQLEIQYGRLNDTLSIVGKCEDLQKQAVEKSKPWYRRIF